MRAQTWITITPSLPGLLPYEVTAKVAALRDAATRADRIAWGKVYGLRWKRAYHRHVRLMRALARRLRVGEVR